VLSLPAFRSFARVAASIIAFLGLVALPSISRAEFVYATSFSTGALVRFNSTDPVNTLTTILPAATLASPTGLAFGSDGHLYVGVSGDFATIAPTIARIDLSDNSVTTAFTFATFDVFPAALVFNGNNLLVGRNSFVGNTGPIVQLANMIGGSPVQGDYTSGGGLASSPGLALSGNGTLYVSDQTYADPLATGPVKRFDAAGNYIDELIADGESGGPPAWQLSGPTGLAIAGDTLYTASIMNGTILVTDLTDDTTQLFADTSLGFSTGPLALLSNGQLLSGDPSGFFDSVFHFNTDGSLVDTYAFGLGQVGGITVAPVPEPGTLALVGAGLMAGAALLRRRRQATMTE
jgi:hypothetical protein